MFTGNYVHDIGFETDDPGAWYAGRDWYHRNNTLFNNTFVNIRQLEAINTVGQSSLTCTAISSISTSCPGTQWWATPWACSWVAVAPTPSLATRSLTWTWLSIWTT